MQQAFEGVEAGGAGRCLGVDRTGFFMASPELSSPVGSPGRGWPHCLGAARLS